MLPRDAWLDLARKLDWTFRYVSEAELFPAETSGTTRVPPAAWADWDEPYRTSYRRVRRRAEREGARGARRARRGRPARAHRSASRRRGSTRSSSTRATLPLAEFAAVIGNLRAGALRRATAPGARWRCSARSTSSATRRSRCCSMHELVKLGSAVRLDAQASTTPNNWVAIAARHLVDELLLASNPIEFAIGDELRVRDRLHEPAVRRALGAGARRRRPRCSRRW